MFSGLSVVQPSARRWTALASFTLQVAVVVAVLVFPMLYPQYLPPVFLGRQVFLPMPDREVQTATTPITHHGGTALPLTQPIVVSTDSHRLRFESVVPSGDQSPGPMPQIGTGDSTSTIRQLIAGPSRPVLPSVRPSERPRTSVMMEGNLVRRVEPQYPAIAKQIRLQGAVVLNAIISRQGNIERLEVASGPALLAGAARAAVEQWKYRPYLLNGEPVEVETQITVNFVLER